LTTAGRSRSEATSSARLRRYLEDPFLAALWGELRSAGPLRPISVDLTHLCNLRCTGCYFFSESLDRHRSPAADAAFAELVAREKERGTNFVTVVGGEPSLELERLATLYHHFSINVATNGWHRIPVAGFENLPIGISVWGDAASDRELRGGGRRDVFARALANYRDDPRAFFYYTVAAGRAHEIETVVARAVDNGNRVLFNFYGDLSAAGGELDDRRGFAAVRREIDRAIERWPERILLSSYLARVVTTGELYGERWGWATCTSVTFDHPVNRKRIGNGAPYNPHFRAYNADFRSTRRCCTGEQRSCASCYDVWEHFSWVMLHLRRHLDTVEEFTDWLTASYLFYLINRLVDFERGVARLPEIHRRTLRGPAPSALLQPPASSALQSAPGASR